MNQISLVARREYLKVVRSRAFWLTTLLLPLVFVVFGAVSGLSSSSATKSAQAQVASAQEIAVVDRAGVIAPGQYVGPFKRVDDEAAALQGVKDGRVDALFVYPADVATAKTIRVYAQDLGLFSSGEYNDAAETLLKQSVLAGLNDPEEIALFNSSLNVTATNYRDGQPAPALASYVLPGLLVVLYFMLIYVSLGYLLTGVSEEKENRVIEIMLTTMRPYRLVWGKLIGLMGVVLTQFFLLTSFSVGAAALLGATLPAELNLATLPVNPAQLLLGLFYLLAGLLLMASLQIGVGAVMPSAREAGRFSAIFILLAVSPIYFFSTILQAPHGTVAQITSYFPLTAPFVLLLRNAIFALTPTEALLGVLALSVYVVLGLYAAFALFKAGALEYSQRLPLGRLFGRRTAKSALAEPPAHPVR